MNKPSPRAVRAHMKETKFPRVGVAVIIQRGDLTLLRRCSTSKRGAGTWSLPGGAMDFGETIVETATRELREKTGLILLSPWCGGTYSACVFEDEHWVTFFVGGTIAPRAEPERTEPEKCSCWKWVTREEMDHLDLFAPLAAFREKYGRL